MVDAHANPFVEIFIVTTDSPAAASSAGSWQMEAKVRRIVVMLLFLLITLPMAIAQNSGEHDRQAIRTVMDRFMDAWNRHDAKAFASVFAEDADFTNWRGEGASDRSKIEEFHAPIPRFSRIAIRATRVSRFASCAPTSRQWTSVGR